MKRADFLKQLAFLSAGSALLPKLKFPKDSPFTELRNGVGIFTMQGGTIGWLTTDDAIVAIDSQYPDPAEKFVSGISSYGGGPEKVLFNTHHHGDHTGGNPVFAENGYRIIGHANVPDLQRIAAEGQENQPTVPDTTFEEDFDLSVGNETIHAKYYGPGHTKGDSVIWFEHANIAHMGDLVFNRLYPYIDRGGGAMIANWIPLLEQVADEADSDTLFIFGHGNPEFGVTGSSEDLLHLRDFFSHLMEYTRKGITAGKSKDEITNIQSFEEFPDFVSPSDFLSLSANVDVAYRELTEAE
ncbi:MBL fold metallo-hydrolase [Rhodohalobacter sp. 614A]|uniref:MBL fold metallo-hydrolase n=1 Tax=Rhodohalobacter sp. 614A TaxID=2908649 RepID=UPI001F20C6C1|nr:MBL fold metallo-hydrolase [Rhodohalobacter sp. 614A]